MNGIAQWSVKIEDSITVSATVKVGDKNVFSYTVLTYTPQELVSRFIREVHALEGYSAVTTDCGMTYAHFLTNVVDDDFDSRMAWFANILNISQVVRMPVMFYDWSEFEQNVKKFVGRDMVIGIYVN